jgi:Holliday junction DNA helicase RuvA
VIASISGTLVATSSDALIVEVGGVGYELLVPAVHLNRFKPGEQARLLTRMVVREDSITLYGFLSEAERGMFDALCAISGVGPKLALAVISGLGVDGLSAALMGQDEQALRSVSGVGQKTARLILLSLTDRAIAIAGNRQNLVSALVNLGVSTLEAQNLATKVDSQLDDAAALREALRLRSGRG